MSQYQPAPEERQDRDRERAQMARAFDGWRFSMRVIGPRYSVQEVDSARKRIDADDAQVIRQSRVARDRAAMSETELRALYGDR
jgi:hypothetical protein